MKKVIVKDIEIFRTLYGAPFQDTECEHCGNKNSSGYKCPFCGYPKNVEFMEGEDNEPSKIGP